MYTHTHTGEGNEQEAGGGGNTDHPDFGGVGHLAALLEHPTVVGEELLQAHAHGEDEGEPEQRAEQHRRHHRLTLGTQRLTGRGSFN